MSAILDRAAQMNWNIQDINLVDASFNQIQAYWGQDLLAHEHTFPERPFGWNVHLLKYVVRHNNYRNAVNALRYMVRCGLVIDCGNGQIRSASGSATRDFLNTMVGAPPPLQGSGVQPAQMH